MLSLEVYLPIVIDYLLMRCIVFSNDVGLYVIDQTTSEIVKRILMEYSLESTELHNRKQQ